MGGFGELEAWSLLLGIGLPPLIAVIQQPKWSDKARAVWTVGTCLVAGAVTTWLQHGHLYLDQHLFSSMATIVVAAQATYRNFWKPTGAAPAIESATSPHKR